jgi:polysaccharide pyruvyl transferase WcaK-like protein
MSKTVISKINLCITGYYYKQNLGDDLLLNVAKKIFISKYSIDHVDVSSRYIGTDTIQLSNTEYMDELTKWSDYVILFGGEVLNSYFIDRLITVKQYAMEKHRKNIPFYAFGVSTNTDYPEIVSKVDLFEYIIFRNRSDYNQYLPRLTSEHCCFLPDAVFLLKPDRKSTMKRDSVIKKRDSKCLPCCDTSPIPKPYVFHIGFFISQTAKNDTETIYRIIGLIRQCIYYHAKVYLFTMCNGSVENENDTIMNTKIYDELNDEERKYVSKIDNPSDIFTYLPTLDFTVCWRFHAHVFSIQYHIPFLSISSTPKVKTLLQDTKLESLSFVNGDLREGLEYLLQHKDEIRQGLSRICNRLETDAEQYKYWHIRLQKVRQIPRFPINHMMDRIITGMREKFMKHTRENDDSFNATLLLYLITGRLQTVYHWGLTEKFAEGKTFDMLRGDIEWLIQEQIKEGSYSFYYKMAHYMGIKNEYKIPKQGHMINIHYMDQNDMKGVHRAGWQYVISHIEENLATFHPLAIHCDLYLDRTFHWNYNTNCQLGIIPYVKPWVGFIHHTSNTEYTNFNVVEMFKKPALLESLKRCRGLFVLSSYLRKQITTELKNCGHSNIPVVVLYHPTEFISEDRCFNMTEFEKLESRRVVQVGAWYRNIEGIFRVKLGVNPLHFNRFALKGPQMDGYYAKKVEDASSNVDISMNVDQMKISRDDSVKMQISRDCKDRSYHFKICKIENENNQSGSEKSYHFKICMTGDEKQPPKVYIDRPVELIDKLNDMDYDDLFRLSVIFINLIDGSAVNTIIESIVRNTPILVNPLEAVVEYLGKDYPFYYNSYEELTQKIGNMDLIRKTHQYLKKMDKRFLTIEHFISSFRNAPIFHINNMGRIVHWSKGA